MEIKIGTRAYPVDNSYSFTIGTNENPFLAGYLCGKPPARKVTIISNPYTLDLVNIVGENTKLEFVTVSYNREHHVVLNNFTDKKPKGVQDRNYTF